MTVQTQPQGVPVALLAGRPQQQHTVLALRFLISPAAERRHHCTQMAFLTLIPSCPFQGTTLTIAKCYFHARPVSAGSRQQPRLYSPARLSPVGPPANPSYELGLSLPPSGHWAPLTGPKVLQDLCTNYHPRTKTSSPLDKLQMVFHTLPSVSLS